MYYNWQEHFGLTYEDMDTSFAFYLSFKRLLHKLKKNTSIAVTDDIFLNFYFAEVI